MMKKLLTISLCIIGFAASAHAIPLEGLLPPEVTFPEGVSIDKEGSIYVGGITTGVIARFAPGSSSSEIFVPQGVLTRGAVGLRVDDSRGILWACDASPFITESADLVALSLQTGEELARHPVPDLPSVICNDITVNSKGDVFVSESRQGLVLKLASTDVLVDRIPLKVWSNSSLLQPIGEPAFGANGLTTIDQTLFVGNFNTGDLVAIEQQKDGTAAEAQRVTLLNYKGQPASIIAIDGLIRAGKRTLIGALNGVFSGTDAIVRIRLVRWKNRWFGFIETIDDTISTPATLDIVKSDNGSIVWVTESQFDHLFGIDPSPAGPHRIIGIELPKSRFFR